MKILYVHNEYGKISGEEIMISRIVDMLKDNGHEVPTFFRKSSEIATGIDKLKAFISGIYSVKSRREFREIIKNNRPDLIQVQNMYPLISPSVLVEAYKQSVPVVMRCANYRLICPTGLYATNGQICEKCNNGEYWCVLRNCTGSLPKSIGYALRNYYARVKRLYLDNVTVYYAQTDFQRQCLVQNGFDASRIFVIPNMIEPMPESYTTGDYIGFVGRVSPEKGLQTLVDAAKQLQGIKFKAAGSCDSMLYLRKTAPENFGFCGHIGHDLISQFYDNIRISVVCSTWYEGFPSTILEAMMRSKPVICSRIGGLPEIIDDGITGLLFEPGNADDLAEKIHYLWDRPDLCRKMGRAGREKALREYSPKKYYERLMAVYKKAMELSSACPDHNS